MESLILCKAIIDGTGKDPVMDAYLTIRDGLITEIGPMSKCPRTNHNTVIEARENVILPGLIDCHVHLVGAHPNEDLPRNPQFRIAKETISVLNVLTELVSQGITSVRDCGYPHHGVFAIQEYLKGRPTLGPRLFLCGRGLSVSGGHGGSLCVQVDGEDAFRQAARIELRAGANWLKLMATGGTGDPGERVEDLQMTLDEMRAAIEEAHKRGRKVCAHCSSAEGALRLIEAGVDCIEHGYVLNEESIRLMRRDSIWLSPTMLTIEVEAEPSSKVSVPSFIQERARGIREKHIASFQRALSNGVKIVASTDSGAPHLPLGIDSLVGELDTMIRCGMNNLQAIRAATRDGAELLGIGEELGSLEVGKIADLIGVGGDPLNDISDLKKLHLVMKSGLLVKPHGSDE